MLANTLVIFSADNGYTADPREDTNLLADGTAANDPPAAELATLSARLDAMATCAGAGCVV